jgi:hypothetical protein
MAKDSCSPTHPEPLPKRRASLPCLRSGKAPNRGHEGMTERLRGPIKIPDGSGRSLGKKVVRKGPERSCFMAVLKPGDEPVTLIFTVPVGKAGERQMGCFENVGAHWDLGMHGKWIVSPRPRRTITRIRRDGPGCRSARDGCERGHPPAPGRAGRWLSVPPGPARRLRSTAGRREHTCHDR